jgi:polysaccharide export outer membrane protein
MSRLSRLRTAIALSAACAASAGCAGPKPEQLAAFSKAYEQEVAGGNCRVAPPDMLEITSPNVPEVDNEHQGIRPDGKITLRLVGDVQVAGLTPVEIADKLQQQLAQYYVEPKVMVRIVSAASKRYYVFGEVGGQGAYPFSGNDSLVRALAVAQPNRAAWKEQVHVIRPSHDSKERHELVINVDDIIKHGKMENNVLLQEGDIIYVPPTPLAWLGQQIGSVLFPVSGSLGLANAPLTASETAYQYTLPPSQRAGIGYYGY